MKTKLKQRFKVASFTLPNGDKIYYKLIGNMWYYAGNSSLANPIYKATNSKGLFNDTTAQTLMELTPVSLPGLLRYAEFLNADKKSFSIAIREWDFYA